MINLAANYNRLGVPDGFYSFIKNLPTEELYENYSGNSMGLIDTGIVAEFFGVTSEQALITTGSTESIDLITQIVAEKNAYMLEPTFWEYKFFSKLRQDSDVVTIKARDDHDIEAAFKKHANAKSAIVYICNPNNPTGSLLGKQALLHIIDERPSYTFVIDETYLFFNQNYNSLTLSLEATKRSNLFVVSSFSKIFSLPGLRLGVVTSSDDNIEKMRLHKVPYSTLPLQLESINYLLANCRSYIEESSKSASSDATAFYDYLDKAGYEYNKTGANFIFIDGKASGLSAFLLERGIVVRDGGEFGESYANYIRLRLCSPGSNEWQKLVKALDEFKRMYPV